MFKKKLKLITLGSIGIIGTTIGALTTLSFNKKNKDQFEFNGRIFNSKEEAYKYLIQAEKISTNQIEVLGNLPKSFANAETGQLNKSMLPTFDPSKTKFYYYNAGGGITNNYNNAKNSYYNPGRIRTMYSDNFSDKLFLSEAQAKQSLEDHKMSQMIPIYDVDFISGATQDYNKPLITKTVKVNPFNKEDINAYKSNIKDHIMDIIMSNVNQDKKDNSGEYQVDFINKNPSNIKSAGFNLAKFIKNEDSSFKFDDKTNELSKEANYWTPDVSWQGPETKIGSNSSYDDDKNFSVDFGNKTLVSRVANYGDRFSWIKNEFNGLTKDDILELLNLSKKSDWLKYKGSKKIVKSDLKDNKQYFIKSLMNVKNGISFQKIQDHLKKNNIALANGPLSRYYINKITSQLKSSIDNLILNVKTDFSFETGNISFYPSIYARIFWHWYSAWDKNDYVSMKHPSDFSVYYNSKTASSIGSTITEIDSNIQNNLFNYLSSWKNGETKEITIKKYGHPIFHVDLNVNPNKGISVSSIKVANNNQKNESNNKNNPILEEPQSVNLIRHYKDFYKEITLIKNDGSNYKILNVFDKYFQDDKLLNVNYQYKNNLKTNSDDLKMILNEDIVKVYFTAIKHAYDQYRNEANVNIFKTIKDHLIGIKDVLIIKGMYKGQPIFSPHLAKYILKSINSFNAKASSGLFKDDSINNKIDFTLALDALAWANLKSRPNNDFPSQILVAYDNNGQKINTGNYQYDDEALLEFNIKLRLEPRRDLNHIFVQGHEPLSNELHKIYELVIKDKKIYFNTFKNLKEYVYNYINNNSYNI